MLTRETLKELLDYNPETGIFTWRFKPSRKVKIGDTIKYIDPKGYVITKIKGKQYQAHRLAWLYMTGNWPEHNIDHINGDRADNRIENLRDVSQRENCCNYKKHRSGRLQGCSYHKQAKKWVARITINNKYIYLGLFQTEQEAHNAYLAAKSLLVSDSI